MKITVMYFVGIPLNAKHVTSPIFLYPQESILFIPVCFFTHSDVWPKGKS